MKLATNNYLLSILSASSNLNIQQMHEGAGGSNQETSSEDEPHLLKHQVTKPSKILFFTQSLFILTIFSFPTVIQEVFTYKAFGLR